MFSCMPLVCKNPDVVSSISSYSSPFFSVFFAANWPGGEAIGPRVSYSRASLIFLLFLG